MADVMQMLYAQTCVEMSLVSVPHYFQEMVFNALVCISFLLRV